MKAMFNAPDLEGKIIEYFEMNDDGQVIIGFDNEIAVIAFDGYLEPRFIIDEDEVYDTLMEGERFNQYSRVQKLMDANVLPKKMGNDWINIDLKMKKEQMTRAEAQEKERRYEQFLILQKEFGTVNGYVDNIN